MSDSPQSPGALPYKEKYDRSTEQLAWEAHVAHGELDKWGIPDSEREDGGDVLLSVYGRIKKALRAADRPETPDIGTAAKLAERMYAADRTRAIAEADDKIAAKLYWGLSFYDGPSWETQQKYLRWASLAWELRLPEAAIAAWRGEVGDLQAKLAEAVSRLARGSQQALPEEETLASVLCALASFGCDLSKTSESRARIYRARAHDIVAGLRDMAERSSASRPQPKEGEAR